MSHEKSMPSDIEIPGKTKTLPTGGTEFKIIAHPPGGGGQTVSFPAYINSINSSFGGSWTEHNDMGHGDPKLMYGSHTQTLDVEFMVAAIDGSENHKKLIKALNGLSDLTKPVYKGSGFNGVMAQVFIGSYIQGIYGFMESVSVSVDNETPWEMNKLEGVPFYMTVSFTMRVVSNKNDRRPWFRGGDNGTFYDGGYEDGFTDAKKGNSNTETETKLGRGDHPERKVTPSFGQILKASVGSSFKNALKI